MKKLYYWLFVLILFANKTSAQTLFNDSFDGTVLNSNWFVLNPNPGGEVRLTGSGELLMHASALNGGSDIYSATNYNAPQMYQPVDTANHHWLVETKLRFNCTNDYEGAGIDLHISADPKDSTAANRIIEKQYSPLWQGQSVLGISSDNNVYTDSIIYLRCGRSTDSIRVWYSTDSSTWNFLGAIADTPIYFVGLFAVRQPWDNETNVDSYAYFDYFHAQNTTGIADVSRQTSAVTIFPNPSDGNLNLNFYQQQQRSVSIELFNALSQRVFMSSVKNVTGTIPLHLKAAAGIYYLEIKNDESKILSREKIAIVN
jgi:hypothetical protein